MYEYSNYLAHHGIEGMRWGKRNGPPYPLERTASGKIITPRQRRLNKIRDAKEASKKRIKQAKIEQRQKNKLSKISEREKEKLSEINGTTESQQRSTLENRKEYYRNTVDVSKMSDQELQDINRRLDLEKQFFDKVAPPVKNKKTVMSTVKKLAGAALADVAQNTIKKVGNQLVDELISGRKTNKTLKNREKVDSYEADKKKAEARQAKQSDKKNADSSDGNKKNLSDILLSTVSTDTRGDQKQGAKNDNSKDSGDNKKKNLADTRGDESEVKKEKASKQETSNENQNDKANASVGESFVNKLFNKDSPNYETRTITDDVGGDDYLNDRDWWNRSVQPYMRRETSENHVIGNITDDTWETHTSSKTLSGSNWLTNFLSDESTTKIDPESSSVGYNWLDEFLRDERS